MPIIGFWSTRLLAPRSCWLLLPRLLVRSSIHRRTNGSLRLRSALNCAFARLEVLAATLACNLEPKNRRLVVEHFGRQAYRASVLLYEHLSQRGSKKGSVQVESLHRHVNLFALGAVDLHSALAQLVVHAVGENSLLVAERSLAESVASL